MSASLVFASGLAYAQETTPTPTPGAVDTPVAPSDSTETPIVVVDPIVTDDETGSSQKAVGDGAGFRTALVM